MFDIKWIRENSSEFDAGLNKRSLKPIAKYVIELDEEKRKIQTELQVLQSERNNIAKEIGQAKRDGKDVDEITARANHLKTLIPELEEKVESLSAEIKSILEKLPNLPANDVPVGDSESYNKEIRQWGTPRKFDFTPKPHYEIGEELGLMDFETAAKISGARFVILKADLARLERAIARFMIDSHTKTFGYLEIAAPVLVRTSAMYGTGQLPKFGEDAFQTTDGRWLVPTSEVSLTNMVAEEIIEAHVLPLRYTAYSQCFRSEAGSAGRDTRGMIRQHQFSKVEMVSIVHPDQSAEEHERMTSAAEEILKKLELPFRTMLLCSGDMGPSANKTYDLEVWIPSEGQYREISSCSNCGTFQAKRMNARFKENSQVQTKNKTEYVHTLNGSGLAVGRTIVAIVENYQNADGSVTIPEALVPYMDGQKEITR